MATPKKKYKYVFIYEDQTYLTYELTKEDFYSLEQALCHGEEWKYVSVSIGILSMSGIRSIIEQKEDEEEQETPVDTNPPLDQDSYNWLKENGGF